jgi:hypothetical protein
MTRKKITPPVANAPPAGQAVRIGNGHEIPRHVSIGHRNRTARGNLPEKKSYERSVLPKTLPNLTAAMVFYFFLK